MKLNIPLINTHTHSPMVAFRWKFEDVALEKWLNECIWPTENKMLSKEFVYKNAKIAFQEMKKNWIKAICDMYFFSDEICKVAEEEKIIAVASDALFNFENKNAKTPRDWLIYTENLLKKYKGSQYAKPCVSPHAIYTLSSEFLIEAKKLAKTYNSIYHLHIAETKKEFDDCLKEHWKTPIRYLYDLGLLDDYTLLAHCVWLTDEDIEIIAETKSNVAHCPLSNLKLWSGIAPITKMLDKNINICLWTDWAASSNRLDIWEAGKFAALLQKWLNQDPSLLNTNQIIKMMSINWMKALKIDYIDWQSIEELEKIIDQNDYNYLYELNIEQII